MEELPLYECKISYFIDILVLYRMDLKLESSTFSWLFR